MSESSTLQRILAHFRHGSIGTENFTDTPTIVLTLSAEDLLSDSAIPLDRMLLGMHHSVRVEVDLRDRTPLGVTEAYALKQLAATLVSLGEPPATLLVADSQSMAVLHIFRVLSSFVLQAPARAPVTSAEVRHISASLHRSAAAADLTSCVG